MAVFERGWLSSNSVLLSDAEGATSLVDSGYALHAPQTVALVEEALRGKPLDLLVNTHLHSDHCGGNAALQARYPAVRTLIPPGQAELVRDWDTAAFNCDPTGQECPRFGFQRVLVPGLPVQLGRFSWEVHASPGHDPHSVILFDPCSGILISGDALWADGFGVVFPELEGLPAFGEVATTLDVIEGLAPSVVIPGHGPVFSGSQVAAALSRARSRLASFVANPARHARHAAKVLLKFRLMAWQKVRLDHFLDWAMQAQYLRLVASRYFPDVGLRDWLEVLVKELVGSGAARFRGDMVENS